MHVERESNIPQLDRPAQPALAPLVEWMVEVATGRVVPRTRARAGHTVAPVAAEPPAVELWQ